MEKYKLSTQATDDISGIADYSIQKWGIQQARKYRNELIGCFKKLANHPTIGRDVSEFDNDLHQYPYKAHTIFYQTTDYGIFIIRILNQKMDFNQHF